MSRRSLDPWPGQLHREEVQRAYCPKRNARPGEPCRSKQRVPKSHHLERVRLRIEELQIDVRGGIESAAAKKWYP
jgi:hypothetical protein